MIDKNELIDNYSESMGNRESGFIEYATKNGISEYRALIQEFKSIQNQVYDYIYKITEPNKQLTAQEIESISFEFCTSIIDWIDKKGVKAVNRWLIWMCWHEGILKKNE
nr:hypothetical protein [uncultured Carboxylicivirga sp.]